MGPLTMPTRSDAMLIARGMIPDAKSAKHYAMQTGRAIAGLTTFAGAVVAALILGCGLANHVTITRGSDLSIRVSDPSFTLLATVVLTCTSTFLTAITYLIANSADKAHNEFTALEAK